MEDSVKDKEIDIRNLQRFHIGRDDMDTIFIEDDSCLSTHHALMEYDEIIKNWKIMDHGRHGTGSSNGTWMGIGTDTTIIVPGQIIRINTSQFLSFKEV